MLSRAFVAKPRWVTDNQDQSFSCKTGSILEYSDDCLVGFVDDLPIMFTGGHMQESQLTLREILRASVGVMGESKFGMTEKVVLLEGKMYAVKRFRKVNVRRKEFGKRIQRLSCIAEECDYLVPVVAYLYSKRIKFVVSHYFPMGSLADLLAGAREFGHTALEWKQRLKIAIDIAYAIAYIHTQCPPYQRRMQLNIHGNIKASNVMINTDFTACLSDYGFPHLAEPDDQTTDQLHQPGYRTEFSQETDIYNYGTILLDLLGGPRATTCSIKWLIEIKEWINKGEVDFFEFPLECKVQRQQAMKVLDIALACRNKTAEARPCIESIIQCFGDVYPKK